MKEPKRFWSKVDVGEVDECWEWLAGKSHGYGRFSISKKLGQVAAHRVAWILTYGAIPEGLHCCHYCDNRGCCNPYHLFLGTHADNMQDAAKKGQKRYKLTEDEVREIRELLKEGVPRQEIANEFEVSKKMIGDIRRGKFWAWLV